MSAKNTSIEEAQRFGKSIRAPSMQAQLKAALPGGMSIDRFTTTTQVAINHNIDLLQADRQSLYNSIIRCAQEGLLPDGVEAVLNIYSVNTARKGEAAKYVNKVQYMRMVGGLIKQFEKAGIKAYAVSVYEADDIQIWNDNDGQHVIHKPCAFGKRGAMIGAFAAGKTPNGSQIVEHMNLDDIEKVRAQSRSADGERSPWRVWYDRMSQKSCLHRLRKRVAVVDEEASAALSVLDKEFEPEPEPEDDPPTEPTPVTPTQDGQQNRRPKALQSVIDTSEGSRPGDPPGEQDVV